MASAGPESAAAGGTGPDDPAPVSYAHADGVARIHLDRPHRLNAVTTELVEGLLAAFARADADGARAVVLAGRGRAFCSGYDLKEPDGPETTLATRARIERMQDLTRVVRRSPAVVVAAVHGYALGAGAEIALGCDLVVAAEDASLGFPEVGVGLSVTGGISATLPAAVGLARAKELLLLGERLDARTAASWGLVNRVVPVGEHEEAALAWAVAVRDRPALATALAKQVLDRGAESGLEQALATEVDHAVAVKTSNEAGVFDA